MADIFMSYARDDRSKAELLAKAFEGRNWSVWWDTRLKAGEVWDEVIERELNAARCVVVLWSKISVDRQWVRVEAYDGLQRHILVPALIENVRPPLAFRLVQAEQLLDWSGEPSHTGLNRLFAAVSERLETQPRRVGSRLPPDLVERFVTVSTTTNSVTRLFQMIINGEIDPMIRAIDEIITLTRFSGETSYIKGRLDRIKNEFIERWTGYVSAYDTRYSDTLDTLRYGRNAKYL